MNTVPGPYSVSPQYDFFLGGGILIFVSKARAYPSGVQSTQRIAPPGRKHSSLFCGGVVDDEEKRFITVTLVGQLLPRLLPPHLSPVERQNVENEGIE